ncbi:hypothetical protein [Microbacterium sp. CIAB417]|uniref:hypothetical protein n=1 Tax=Microbacterium sp. CIAB417 TaxID=2860287 RepID=UPI001FABDC79|nr:hypothetical protein [Microbacterium sp. CIAB417]
MTIAQLHRSTSHPPCPEDREILEIPVPVDRTELALADRLSLRIGLWLLLRTQRRRTPSASIDVPSFFPGAPNLTQHEALTLLTFDLQRQLR